MTEGEPRPDVSRDEHGARATLARGEDAAVLQAAMAKLRLVAFMVAGTVATTVFVLWLVTSGVITEPIDMAVDTPWIFRILLSLAAVALVAAPLVERYLLRDPAASVSGGDDDVGERLRRYTTAKMVGLGLRELVGTLGFILGLFGYVTLGYALLACSLIALALGWPRQAEVAAFAARAGNEAATFEPR